MDPDKQVAKRTTLHTTIEGIVLAGTLCVLTFALGGPDTRRLIIAILGGTVYNAAGEPAHADPAPSETPPLRLLGHGCHQEYGYQMCEGEVRNTSGERLENVMVEVRFQDTAGGFIKSEDALIDYQPLMPGQTSPFKLGTMHNPLIRHYTIRFKQMFGGELKAAR